MSKRSLSPMEQGEIEASPDLRCSPDIYLDDPDDAPRTPLVSQKDKSGKSKHNEKQDSRSPDRHEETEDALSIQPPQPSHQKKDKHRHHKHSKGSHRSARGDQDKYPPDGRRGRGDDRQIIEDNCAGTTHSMGSSLWKLGSGLDSERKYDDKTHGKPSKKVSEVSAPPRDFSKPDREVEALRRQKSLIERERLERLERERHRIEKEKDREYWAKMKKSEQEQGSRSDIERRPRPEWTRKDADDRDRQISEEMMKKRGRGAIRKGRQRSRTRSRSPIQPLIPSKDLIKDVRRNVKELRRGELGQNQRHELWSSKESKQRTEHNLDRFSDQELYLRNKAYGGFGKHGASAHVDPVEQNPEDNSEISDRTDSEDDNRDHGRDNSEHAGRSSGSPNGSEISSASNASGSKSDRSGSHVAGIESRHNSPRDDLRSKFDDEKHTNSGTRESENSESDYEEDRGGERNDKYLDESPVLSSPESELQLPPYFPALQGCRNVEEFHCLNRIEEGTYGVVYRAIDLKMEEVVALKRLKMEKEKEGFPITSLREINTLLKAQHHNVVTVREIVVGSNMDKIYIVMDYVEHDLKSLMEYMKEPFSIGEVKTLLLQLLRGVAHLHDNWIIHRDLKASNLLLSHKGILKIGDFGLAREYGSPLRPYTPIVVTLWYRAPELLLGTKQYSTPIDLWSVGCIFAEFLTRKPLFPGKSEIDQLNKIFKELGTPNEKIWPGVNELPAMKKCTFTEYPYNQLQAKFKNLLTAKGLDLLNRFLTYNPEKRVTAEDAKKHEFFAESPLPVDPSMFPTWPAKSEQSRTRTHGNSPKPPSGGKAYAKLLADDEEYGARFHIGVPALGDSTKSTGFALKF